MRVSRLTVYDTTTGRIIARCWTRAGVSRVVSRETKLRGAAFSYGVGHDSLR